jgi:hypothetical protein
MSDDFEVRGADQFLAVSKRLKAAGETELRKELNSSVKKATKPLIAKSRARAEATLPARGGLARKVSKAPQRVQTRTGKDPGVRVVVAQRAGIAARASNRGMIRHPVFGNTDVWVSQKVPAGWFDESLKAGASEVRPEIEAAIIRVNAKVAGK